MCDDLDMYEATMDGYQARGRPSAWESALERFMILDSDTRPAKANPHPPIGRGLKPRPPLLEIPHFTPPPPTPQPLFGFQKPQMNAYTQHLLQQQRQRLYLQQQQQEMKEQRQRQQQQQQQQQQLAKEQQPKKKAAPVRTRRPRVWDLLPDSPDAAARTRQAQQHAAWSSTAQAPRKAQHEPAAAGPQKYRGASGQVGAQSEPRNWIAHREPSRGASSAGEAAASQSMVSDSARGYSHQGASACSPTEKRGRASLQCGVDLSLLWEAFYEALFFPAIDCSAAVPQPASDSPCACRCACQPTPPVLAPAPGSAPDRFAPVRCQVEEEAIAYPALCDDGLYEDFTTPVAAAKINGSFRSMAGGAAKGGVQGGSPMSVLTPRSAEKSSAGSSPCAASLLAFIEPMHVNPVA